MARTRRGVVTAPFKRRDGAGMTADSMKSTENGMAGDKWQIELRDDQVVTLLDALDYIIARHDGRLQAPKVLPIDVFAHEQSRKRLQEIRGHIHSSYG